MTSSPSSRLLVLALLVSLAVSVAIPAGAVSVGDSTVPTETAAGDTYTAEWTLTNLYKEPSFESWSLEGETELTNVTWTVSFINPSGETVAKLNYDSQSFKSPEISSQTDIDGDGQSEAITELRIEVRGTAPAPQEYIWPEQETFLVATLTQTRGESGSVNEIDSWSAFHYTTGGEESPGTKEAREALSSAAGAIESADEAGANVEDANSTFSAAVQFYESGQFDNAIDQATRAEEQANKAKGGAQQGQLLLFGGVGLLALLVLAGGVWYWRSQQDTYDKLG